ncbi:thioredoxin-like protein, partial [Gorgonomyces haynaldii]
DPDEKIIAAIKRLNDPDYEQERIETDSDISSVEEEEQQIIDPDMKRMMEDSALRQHLGIGPMSGPKSVIADKKFHERQERARQREKQERDFQKMSDKALKSGWLQRQLESEETLELDEDAFFEEYRQKRLMELQNLSLSRFGSVIDLNVDTFISAVEDEDPNVLVIVHMYQPRIQECRVLSQLLVPLARKYPGVKVCKIVATDADPDFDPVAYPCLFVYHAGDLVQTCLRLTDEIGNWARTGRCEFEELEQYLLKQGVLSESDA